MPRHILLVLLVVAATALPEGAGPESCTVDHEGCTKGSGFIQVRSSKKNAVEDSGGTEMLNSDVSEEEGHIEFDAERPTTAIWAPRGSPPLPTTWAQWSLFLADSSCEMKEAGEVGGYNLHGTYRHRDMSEDMCRMMAMRKRHRYSAYGNVEGVQICYSFPICLPSTATSMPGVSVHRLQSKLWGESATCRVEYGSLESWASEMIRGEVPLSDDVFEGVCQELADRQGHGFYRYHDGTCYSSRACTSTQGDPVREQPAPRHPAVACETEEKIKAVVERHIFEKMPFSNRTYIDGRRTRASLPATWVDRPMPSVVRDIFHDARDWNRLAVPSGDTWRLLEEGVDVDGDYGGVDGCVYERTYTDWIFNEGLHASGNFQECMWGSATGACDTSKGDAAQENWNLQLESENQDVMRIARPAYSFAVNACNELCCDASSPLDDEEKVKLCGAASCESDDSEVGDMCVVDMTVFGALRIIKRLHGPEISMTWGRRQGDCRNILKDVVTPSSGGSPHRVGFDDPHMAMFHDTAQIWKGFERLGFSKHETVALMGAHSIGKNNKYPGGPDTRNRGHGFCGNETQLDPPLGREQFDAASGLGSCTPWKQCYTIREDDGQIEASPSRRILRDRQSWDAGAPGWDDGGGFWDHTPSALDNDYFRMLSTTNPDDKNACCGPWHDTVQACQSEGSPMQFTNGTDIVHKGCAVDWCMYSRGEGNLGGGPPQQHWPEKNNVMMISTKAYVGRHRLYRYAADWMLIEDPVMKTEVDRFASDEDAFHQAFAGAFTKLINKGWSDADVKICSAYTA